MPTESFYFIAFTLGFLGSSHCVAMCGGIVGMLSSSNAQLPKEPLSRTLTTSLSYNAGRIFSYSLIGLLAGGIGELALSPIDHQSLQIFSKTLTSIFMFSFGFYLFGWLGFLSYLERMGQHLWARISPLSKGLLPIKNKRSAFALGVIWGWLPCGLVYSALAWSLASAHAIEGALIMLSFGLGTLPMLLAIGTASKRIAQFRSSLVLRRIVGSIIIAFAIFNLLPTGGGHHHSPTKSPTSSSSHHLHH
ncbi:MAG: sulfite exporter TauE/SafE family protein [Cycloclasticus sp.]|nr:sulfite exporter TauE/SafE family protein [Cycloclasticus sp.]